MKAFSDEISRIQFCLHAESFLQQMELPHVENVKTNCCNHIER